MVLLYMTVFSKSYLIREYHQISEGAEGAEMTAVTTSFGLLEL